MKAIGIKKRRRIWKYVMAVHAFNEADLVAGLLGNMGEGIEDQRIPPLWTALVVSYCRPFTHNNNVGPIDISYIPKEYRRTHDMLWGMRNSICGHNDHEETLDDGSPLLEAIIYKDLDGIGAWNPGGRPSVVRLPDVLSHIHRVRKIYDDHWKYLLKKELDIEDLSMGEHIINLSEDETSPLLIMKGLTRRES